MRLDDGYPRYVFVDGEQPEAKMIKTLLASFPGYLLYATIRTDLDAAALPATRPGAALQPPAVCQGRPAHRR